MTMQIPTESEMKEALLNNLLPAIEASANLQQAISVLNDKGAGINDTGIGTGFDIDDIVQNIIQKYFTSLCASLNEDYTEHSAAKIELNSNYYTFRAQGAFLTDSLWDRLYKSRNGSLDLHQILILECLECIPFGRIESDLNNAIKNLHADNCRIVSDRIISSLSLYRYRRNNVCFKRGFFVSETSAVGDSLFQEGERFFYIEQSLFAVQQECGVDFGSAVSEIRKYIWEMRGFDTIPSRTCFGKGGNLEIHCFNKKTEFRFSEQGFDAIVAFILVHGDEACVEKITKITNDLQKAA